MFVAYLLNLYIKGGFFLYGSFGINILLVLTTLPYDSNSVIQGGCQLLLKFYITDLYEYCIFVEYLYYKVLMFCLYGSFGVNILLVLTTLPYNSNSNIQGGFQLLIKISITDFYFY